MGWSGAVAATAVRLGEVVRRAVADADLPLRVTPARLRAMATDRGREVDDHDIQLYVHRHGVYRARFAVDRETDGGPALETAVRSGTEGVAPADAAERLFPVAGDPAVEEARATPSLFESTVDQSAARAAVRRYPDHDYERLTDVARVYKGWFPGAVWEPVFVDADSDAIPGRRRYFDVSPARAGVLIAHLLDAVEDDHDDEVAALYLAGMATYHPSAFTDGHVDRIDSLLRPGSGVPGPDADDSDVEEFLMDVERLKALRRSDGEDVVSERTTLKEQLHGEFGYDTVSAAERLLDTHDRTAITARDVGWLRTSGAPSRPDLLVRALAELYEAGEVRFSILARPLRRPGDFPKPEGFRMLLQARSTLVDAADDHPDTIRDIVAAHDEVATGTHADLVDEVYDALTFSRR